MSKTSASITVGGRALSFSNLDKALYPSGFTKGEAIEYYGHVAEAMLPLLKGRAVTLKRYPNGTAAPFFFEKRCPPHKPDWVKTATVIGSTGEVNHCVINDVATLLWAANLAALEFHVPMALASKPNRPAAMVFDLDPGAPATLIDCLRLGLKLEKLLAGYDLKCFAKTSGSKGLHVYVPINSAVTFDQTKDLARHIAQQLEKEDPAGVTATMSKALRTGKVFIDWSQNDRHKTTVCAFSLRALSSPTVSTPISWTEIKSAVKAGDASKLVFDPAAVLKRISKGNNSFGDIPTLKQKLPKLKNLTA
jgi:bifunctional non-homologous end joining protein LigD